MGLWIPGPDQLCWPANRNRRPNTPHEAAIAPEKEQPKPKRTRRTTKKADD